MGKGECESRLFFVNTGVESRNERKWEWCKEDGYISAGGVNEQGRRGYARGLWKLRSGDHFLAYLTRKKNPHGGYVGFGVVQESAVPAREFRLKDDQRLVDKLPRDHPWRERRPPEDDEWIVRVEWLDVLSADEAIWETGMFVSRNVVACLNLKNPRVIWTLCRLQESGRFPHLKENHLTLVLGNTI